MGQQETQWCDGSATVLRNDPCGSHQGMDIAQERKTLERSCLGRFQNHPRKHFEESLEEHKRWEICMGEILGIG